jgi:[DsrC]-trisulfide reductase subunit J
MDDKNIKNEFGNFAPKPEVPKRIYDFKYIVLGLAVFFGLLLVMVGPNLGRPVPGPDPKLDTPAIMKLAKKDRKCVMPKDYMRTYHMQMLVDWRENVIRSYEPGHPQADDRIFVNPEGKKYLASLSNTCLNCHSNKSQFCDQCHNYVSVVPNCFGCHQDKEIKQKVAKAEAK